MTTPPRSTHGFALTKTCPNCGSAAFRQTVFKEECPDCGLRYDWDGRGGNAVYEAWERSVRADPPP